jgi:hypothetical protein|tara:strand:+ start:43 stop:342 length:300 start_codon:yes stop_codon:yes gene_type:complete
MKIKIKLMEMYVNTVMDREEYIVELKKGTGFRGGSKVFNRVVGRQTTLNEFVDLENEPEISLPKNIIYYLNPAHLLDDKILETVNIIVKDINSYLYTQR